MEKFYVKSGLIKKAVYAVDANGAALWLINSIMDRFGADPLQSELDSDPFALMEEGLTLLGDRVTVSRSGFNSSSAQDSNCAQDSNGEQSIQFETVDLLTEWNELVMAVARMESEMLKSTSANKSEHLRAQVLTSN